MPTHEALPRSTTDLDRLTPAQRRRFRQAVNAFVDDLRTGHGSFRAGLRVKGVRSAPSVFEPARAPNGRAMWSLQPSTDRRGAARHMAPDRVHKSSWYGP
ncbi:hypothetical protein Shyd_42650 [Streptomyces hydrogenans]|uniref:Uncharacterized protein n=1 Tax=Streptomyces hydrogenans TaxID=1873719 RepID=A0ABQ3PCY6_9ACTN|nr:hypothetical protein [Streptomyces hydrogenans]GHI22894.1 hypothetical protein Shyd_42650 [Streptomyces hydrogenans]